MRKKYSFVCIVLTLAGFTFLGELEKNNTFVPLVLAQAVPANNSRCEISEKIDQNDAKQAIPEADRLYQEGIGLAQRRESIVDLQESLVCLETALQIYKEQEEQQLQEQPRYIPTREQQGKTYKALGEAHYFLSKLNQGNINIALQSYEDALRIMTEDIKDPKSQSIIARQIGKIYYELGQYEDSERYQKQAYGIANAMFDEEKLKGEILLDLADSQISLEDYKESIKSSQKALSIMQKIDERLLIIQAHRQLGIAFVQTGQYDKAKEELEEAIQQLKQLRVDNSSDASLAYKQIEIADSLKLVEIFRGIRNILPKPSFRDRIRDQIGIPLTISFFAGILCVFGGVRRIEKFIENQKTRRDIGELKSFWSIEKKYNSLGSARKTENIKVKFVIVVGVQKTANNTALHMNYIYAQGIFEIQETLEKIYGSNITIETKFVTLDNSFESNIFEDHVVIVSGEHCHNSFFDFSKQLKTPYFHSLENQKRIVSDQEEKLIFRSHINSNGQIAVDYGTVIRIVSDRGKLIILYDGNYGAGILGAMRATTDKEMIHKTNFNNKEESGFNNKGEAQQLVVQVKNKYNKNNLNLHKAIDIDYHLNWQSFKTDIAEARENFSVSTSSSSPKGINRIMRSHHPS